MAMAEGVYKCFPGFPVYPLYISGALYYFPTPACMVGQYRMVSCLSATGGHDLLAGIKRLPVFPEGETNGFKNCQFVSRYGSANHYKSEESYGRRTFVPEPRAQSFHARAASQHSTKDHIGGVEPASS